MAMSRGPHVRELFIGHQAAFDYDAKESKKSFNVSKKNKAPLHPKLGAYKPKILIEENGGNIPLTHSPPSERVHREVPSLEGNINKAFVIGDKDVPMVLEPVENIYSEIQDPVVTSDDNEQPTSNPIFSDSSPVRSPTEHQGNVYRDNFSRPRSVVEDTIPEEINGVSVPPPDYEEDEVTLDFDGDDDGPNGRVKSIYREFAGEDFAQYMSDDEEDYEFDRPAYTVRSRTSLSRKVLMSKDKKSKTEAWRGDKPKRDSSKSLFKQNTKNGRSTLRHFSVSDTKLGIGMDGNTKQTKPSMRDGVPYESSYESFLQARNGGPRWGSLESASSDSGHETGDDVIREKSSPFWKKLTVKIKKVGYGIKR